VPICFSRNPSMLPMWALDLDILKGCMQRHATASERRAHLVCDADGPALVRIALLTHLVNTYQVFEALQNAGVQLRVDGGCACRNPGERRYGYLETQMIAIECGAEAR
jgi:hypothetical protein